MKYLQALAVSALAIFAPIQAALATVLALIVVDMITGVIAAHKRGEAITSAGLRRSVSKLVIYELTLSLCYIAEHYLIADAIPVMKLVSGMIGLVELTSVLENLNSISGTDLLKTIIQKLGSSNESK